MKKLVKITLSRLLVSVFVFCMSPFVLHADNSSSNSYKKQYINPKSAKVTKKGIVVFENGKKFFVKKLYADKSGKIYYKILTFTKGYTQDVPCPNGCGTFFGRKCPKCGWPEKRK